MDRWEYRVIPLPTLMREGKLETFLNDLGEEGWDLVYYTPGLGIFKRKTG